MIIQPSRDVLGSASLCWPLSLPGQGLDPQEYLQSGGGWGRRWDWQGGRPDPKGTHWALCRPVGFEGLKSGKVDPVLA